MIILGIETSCDETAVSILRVSGDKNTPNIKVLGNTVMSQIKLHEKYGGVFPMMAKREHAKNLIPILEKTLSEAGLFKKADKKTALDDTKLNIILEREPELLKTFLELIPTIERPNIDAIAVTYGPGLEPALWVGINFAKVLSAVWNIPVIPINHMEGHIMSAILPEIKNTESEIKVRDIEFPALALLISGGHTELILVKSFGEYEILGQTRDDAIGEAYDKVARMLELPYPGGPKISELAEKERVEKTPERPFVLPRPMIHSNDLDFSFAGLKTAVLYAIKKISGELTEKTKQQIAKEFEDAVTEVLVSKTRKAMEKFEVKNLIVGGGVIANKFIRKNLKDLISEFQNTTILLPETGMSGDNALMIALAGYFDTTYTKNGLKKEDFRASGNLKLN